MPGAAELASQIKLLRAENSIELTPERTGKRSVSAEEPVTARIRRRAEPTQAAVSELESERCASRAEAGAPSAPDPLPSAENSDEARAWSGRPEMRRLVTTSATINTRPAAPAVKMAAGCRYQG